MSSENDDCPYAKFASALAILMWHFMKKAKKKLEEIFLVSQSVYFQPC